MDEKRGMCSEKQIEGIPVDKMENLLKFYALFSKDFMFQCKF